MKNSEIAAYYDKFSIKQQISGINRRHRAIVAFSQAFCKLNKSTVVLEVGCGVGTVTRLLADIATEGRVHAIDISSQNIITAKANLQKYTNVSFEISDMSNFIARNEYDLVVLPDVIEHIPLDQHAALFIRLGDCLKPDGLIHINIPDPDYLDFVREESPEKLQIIDQSLRHNDFSSTFQLSHLELLHWERYTVFNRPFDYRRIVLGKHGRKYKFLPTAQLPFWRKIFDRIFFPR